MLKIPRNAPNGHIARQKMRLINSAATMTAKRMMTFIQYSVPARWCSSEFKSICGIPPCSAPCGQSLQNTVSVMRYGIRKTVNIKKAYLPNLNHLGIEILGDGIFCKRSCKKPKGQAHPQKNLPTAEPIIIKMPGTKYGIAFMTIKCCSDPTGQAT